MKGMAVMLGEYALYTCADRQIHVLHCWSGHWMNDYVSVHNYGNVIHAAILRMGD